MKEVSNNQKLLKERCIVQYRSRLASGSIEFIWRVIPEIKDGKVKAVQTQVDQVKPRHFEFEVKQVVHDLVGTQFLSDVCAIAGMDENRFHGELKKKCEAALITLEYS